MITSASWTILPPTCQHELLCCVFIVSLNADSYECEISHKYYLQYFCDPSEASLPFGSSHLAKGRKILLLPFSNVRIRTIHKKFIFGRLKYIMDASHSYYCITSYIASNFFHIYEYWLFFVTLSKEWCLGLRIDVFVGFSKVNTDSWVLWWCYMYVLSLGFLVLSWPKYIARPLLFRWLSLKMLFVTIPLVGRPVQWAHTLADNQHKHAQALTQICAAQTFPTLTIYILHEWHS
jgi:hypothetical protein